MPPLRIALLLGAVALLGAAGVFVAASDRDDRPRVTRDPEQSERDDGEERADSDEEARLALRVSSLEARVARLERAARVERPPDDLDESADDEGDVVDNPVFEAAVRDVVDQVEGEQQERRRERRRQRMLAFAADMADELTEQLELGDAQQKRVRDVLRDHFEQMAEMRDQARNVDGGRRGMRQQFREARQKMEADIDAVLTPAQRKKADELRESGDFPGRWGRRGRRR